MLVLAEGTISLTVKEVVPRLAAVAPGGGADGSVAYMHGKVRPRVQGDSPQAPIADCTYPSMLTKSHVWLMCVIACR